MSTSTNEDSRELRSQFRFQPAQKPTTEPYSSAEAAAAQPKSLKTRPRGRFLIAGLMFAACSAGIATVWDSLLRYQANVSALTDTSIRCQSCWFTWTISNRSTTRLAMHPATLHYILSPPRCDPLYEPMIWLLVLAEMNLQ